MTGHLTTDVALSRDCRELTLSGPRTGRLCLRFDDPDDADLVSATSRNWRTRNEVVALALQYRASAQLSFGLEYRFHETRFLQTGTQKNRHLNLAAVMSF